MSEQTFHQEYMNEFWDNRSNLRALAALGDQYHRETEAYDRTVCTGRSVRGNAVPANGEQRKLSVAFANKTHRALRQEAEKLGFDAIDWYREVQRAGRTYNQDITQ